MPSADPRKSTDTGPAAQAGGEASLSHAGDTVVPHGTDTASRFAGSGTWKDTSDVGYWVGRKLGKYEVISVLGTGGMGVVYQAHDVLIERDVAVKLMPREVSANETNLKRFLSEAKAAGKINHPHAVAIYEVAQEGDAYYLVMEFVRGGSIGDRLEKQGALSVLEATRVIAEASQGLGAAHAVGLVHRDVKPANLLVAQDGAIKVADFGLAKGTLGASEPLTQLTQVGQVVGTPYFMSPEQCEGRPIDHRSDLYSLGATYYSLLTGTNPYAAGGSVVQVMYGHCQGPLLDPRDVKPDLPTACSAIIARAMAKRPDDRYQSAAEMLADLNAVLATMSGAGIVLPSRSAIAAAASFPTPAAAVARRRSLALGAGLMLVLLAGLGIVFRSRLPLERHNAFVGPGDAGSGGSNRAGVVPAGPPIRVGILHSLTGTLADSEAPVVDAALLAIDEINASGGVLGRPVEAVVRDGASDSGVFATEARRLIDEEKVSTVFGCWTSASRKTVVPIFEERDHLLVYPVQYEGLEESPNVIYLGAAPNQQILPAVKWAYAFEDKRRFYLVGSDYVFPRTAGAIIKDVLRELGAELVGESYVPLGGEEFKPVVAAILAARPDVILNTINGDSNVVFFKELRHAGVTPDKLPTISFSIGEEELRHLNPAHMAGDFAAWNYFQSIDTLENREFVQRFRAKYGPQRVVTDPMEAAWVGVKLWAQAVAESGSESPSDIRRAMRNRSMTAPEGEVRIDPSTQHLFKTPRIGRILANGQFDIAWTASRPEAPAPYPRSRTPEQWKAFLHELRAGWGGNWAAPGE